MARENRYQPQPSETSKLHDEIKRLADSLRPERTRSDPSDELAGGTTDRPTKRPDGPQWILNRPSRKRGASK